MGCKAVNNKRKEDKNNSVPSKKKELQKLHNEEYYFFWKNNDDPFSSEKPIWTPYEQADNDYLEYQYQQYLKRVNVNVEIGGYAIDFKNWVQYRKEERAKQRPIKRDLRNGVSNVMRKSRFHLDNLSALSQPKIFQIDPKKNIKGQFQSSNIEKSRDFGIISNKLIQVKLLKHLDFQISMDDFSTYVKALIEENNILFKLSQSSSNSYLNILNKLTEDNFFISILRMYTMESFLYPYVNSVLRNSNSNEFNEIKYYYTALMASFNYYSSISAPKLKPFVTNGNFISYRGSRISENELTLYQDKKNVLRVMNEFWSTSLNKETALNFIRNTQSGTHCLYEITIPYKDEDDTYAYFDDSISMFPGENEVLLKSGGIFMINDVSKEEEYYFIRIKVLSFSISGFLHYLQYEETFTDFNLSESNIGDHDRRMAALVNVVKNNKTLTKLNLGKNDLCKNSELFKNFCEALAGNTTLTDIALMDNKLGEHKEACSHLGKAISRNRHIITINLKTNNLGASEEGLKNIAEAISWNSSLETLLLSWNNLWQNERGMSALAEAVGKNNGLTNLDLWSNDLGLTKGILSSFAKAISSNKSLRILDLWGNKIGNDENGFIALANSLARNNTLKEINLNDNNFLNCKKGYLTLLEAIKVNKSIRVINLQYNNIGLDEEALVQLSKALQFNSTVKEIYLPFNKLEKSSRGLKALIQVIANHSYIEKVDLGRDDKGVDINSQYI
jgi:hypothetical protein